MVDTPTTEPTQARAGDTWAWTKTLDDYDSGTYTLSYYLRLSDLFEVKTIVASPVADGSYSVSVAATVTDDYAPGSYRWQSRVSAGATVTTIDSGTFEVLPNFASLQHDHRTRNERIYEALSAVIEGRASTDQRDLTIGDRSISRMSWDELLAARLYFGDAVARERGIKTRYLKVRL